MAKDKAVPAFGGIPEEVTPEEAKWLAVNHPRYEEYRPVIEERLQEWVAANTVVSEPTKKEEQQVAPASQREVSQRPTAREERGAPSVGSEGAH